MSHGHILPRQLPTVTVPSEGTSAWPVLPVWYPSRGSFNGEFVSSAVQFVVSPSPFCFFPHSFLQGQFCNTLGRLPLPTLFLPTFIILRPHTPNSISRLFPRGPDALSGTVCVITTFMPYSFSFQPPFFNSFLINRISFCVIRVKSLESLASQMFKQKKRGKTLQ